MSTRLRLIVACLTLLHAAPALAQSGPGLMLKPWTVGEVFELDHDTYLQAEGETDDAVDADIQISQFEARGRFRFDVENDNSPAIGFDLLHIDLDTDHPALPERFHEARFGIGVPLGKADDWEFALTAGAGYAGTNPYGNDDSWFAHATFIAVYHVDDDSAWQLFLNYDGNRTIFPDVPLPGFAYVHKVDDTLSYAAGIPFTTLHWEPLDPLALDLRYSIPFTIDVTATYTVIEELDLYASFENQFDAFHDASLRDTKRLFFTQRRIEGGVVWRPCANAELRLAGGLAFAQEIEVGFDARDLDEIVDISDQPYIRLGFELSF